MITPEQRRKLESEWSSEDRSIANIGRLAKTAVLALMILGLAWMGAGDESLNSAQQASAPTPKSSWRQTQGESAVPTSRYEFAAARH